MPYRFRDCFAYFSVKTAPYREVDTKLNTMEARRAVADLLRDEDLSRRHTGIGEIGAPEPSLAWILAGLDRVRAGLGGGLGVIQGEYVVIATSYGSGDTGSYRVRVRER